MFLHHLVSKLATLTFAALIAYSVGNAYAKGVEHFFQQAFTTVSAAIDAGH